MFADQTLRLTKGNTLNLKLGTLTTGFEKCCDRNLTDLPNLLS
jgi:hypothetical protein